MRVRIPMIVLGVIASRAGAQVVPQGVTFSESPYKVLQRARVGGEGGFDYIQADPDGRRIYIARRGAAGAPGRIDVYNIETLAHIGEIPNSGGNGVAVDTKSGHGFSSSKPVTMFDTKSMQVIKTIDVGDAQPDGILADPSSQRIYVFSHPTKDATVIDANDGHVIGKIDLGGVPEQGVVDGKGQMYVVMQDMPGGVAVVDTREMKTTTHFPFTDIGRCNGLAFDAKNQVLFAACGASGNPPANPPQPKMVVLSAKDGHVITTLPLAGSSDGMAFNPSTMEAFSTGGGSVTVVKETSPTSFEVEEHLQTMAGARTIAFDPKTNRIFTMSVERGPAPPPPAGGGRGGQAPAVPGSFTILMIGK